MPSAVLAIDSRMIDVRMPCSGYVSSGNLRMSGMKFVSYSRRFQSWPGSLK